MRKAITFMGCHPNDWEGYNTHDKKEVKKQMGNNGVIKNMVETFEQTYVRVRDSALVEFLRANGFRPRNTKSYIVNLVKRLEKAGIEIVCCKANDFFGISYIFKKTEKRDNDANMDRNARQRA